MRLLGIALFAVFLAVMVGHFISEDPGFVVIGYGGKVVRMTFALFVLLVILLVALSYSVLRLSTGIFNLKRRWGQWLGERALQRAHWSLASGILESARGDFSDAEKSFFRGAKEGVQPEAHYLAAANVAQEMNAPARRDNYLQLAHNAEPRIGVTLDIKRAEWLLENDELDSAEVLISSLGKIETAAPRILQLHVELLKRLGDMQPLFELIPDLRRNRVIPFGDIQLLEERCAIAIMGDRCGSINDLRGVWDKLSRPTRQLTPVLVQYVRRLCDFDAFDEAEVLARNRLDNIWDSRVAEIYGDIKCDPPTRQLSQADKWSASHEGDPSLLLTRARLAVRAGLWAQGAGHLRRLLNDGPTPLLYQLQAEVAEARGESATAAHLRKHGLTLAIGDAPLSTEESTRFAELV